MLSGDDIYNLPDSDTGTSGRRNSGSAADIRALQRSHGYLFASAIYFPLHYRANVRRRTLLFHYNLHAARRTARVKRATHQHHPLWWVYLGISVWCAVKRIACTCGSGGRAITPAPRADAAGAFRYRHTTSTPTCLTTTVVRVGWTTRTARFAHAHHRQAVDYHACRARVMVRCLLTCCILCSSVRPRRPHPWLHGLITFQHCPLAFFGARPYHRA